MYLFYIGYSISIFVCNAICSCVDCPRVVSLLNFSLYHMILLDDMCKYLCEVKIRSHVCNLKFKKKVCANITQ